ncbi:MAG: beta-ketoacyl-[acyl-carrier-protein] synthase family protein [Nitrospirota bacterium]
MNKNRVAITGMGIICSLGNNRQEVIRSVKQAQNGLHNVTSIDLSKLGTGIGGEVNIPDTDFPEELRDKTAQLCYIAFQEAYLQSGIDFSKMDPFRIGLSFGTCNGNLLSLESYYESGKINQKNIKDLFQNYFNGLDYLNKKYPIRGEKTTFITACAASNQAIGYAKDLIQDGHCDLVIVGGADSFSKATFAGFNSLQALQPNYCSPFSNQFGISLGEGAAFMILESVEHAKQRNADIKGYVLGYGFGGDAYHITSPDISGDGAVRCMQMALQDSTIDPGEIDFICAHGTGTEANDKAESIAIQKVFQEHTSQLWVTSTKSMHGHTLGASGIVQAVLCLDALSHDLIPPIIHFDKNREGCHLNYVKNTPAHKESQYFLSNSFAFGGNNVSVVLGSKEIALSNKKPEGQKIDQTVITEYACISPLFGSKEEFLAVLKANKCTLDNRHIQFNQFFVTDPKLRKFRKVPRISQLAIEVSGSVLQSSRIDPNTLSKMGLLWGVAKGPLKIFEDYYTTALKEGLEYASALNFPHIVHNSVAGQVSIAYEIKGQNTTISGQLSPFSALFYADRLIRNGNHSTYLVGGSDELSKIDEVFLEDLSFDGCRMSDGAGALLLENKLFADERGAPVLAEIVGYESTSSYWDDHFSKSYEACIERCLKKTNMDKNEIDLHVFTHFGSQDVLGVGPRVGQAVLFDTQRIMGMCESSSAVFSIAAGIECMRNNIAPSIDGIVYEKEITHVLISGSSINGSHYCLILRKPQKQD